LPEAAECGFSATAFQVAIDGVKELYIAFRGNEGGDDNTIKSRRKSFGATIIETYKDREYNVNAILIGSNKNLSQLKTARQFVQYVKSRSLSDTMVYGSGHSLGGHFVQTLQLMDDSFDAGFTLNSAPVNLKLIQH